MIFWWRKKAKPDPALITGKLRPIEWKKSRAGAVWADTIVAQYSVESGVNDSGKKWFVKRIGPWVQPVDSVEQGKQLCEEHYRQEIQRLFE